MYKIYLDGNNKQIISVNNHNSMDLYLYEPIEELESIYNINIIPSFSVSTNTGELSFLCPEKKHISFLSDIYVKLQNRIYRIINNLLSYNIIINLNQLLKKITSLWIYQIQDQDIINEIKYQDYFDSEKEILWHFNKCNEPPIMFDSEEVKDRMKGEDIYYIPTEKTTEQDLKKIKGIIIPHENKSEQIIEIANNLNLDIKYGNGITIN